MKMRRSTVSSLAIDRFADVRRQFEHWRQSRTGRSRVPEDLWGLAAGVAGEYGLYRTARELRLNYNALKVRIKSASPSLRRKDPSPSAFIEMVSPCPAPFSECTVEIEDRRGAKMRIHLKSSQAPDLETISNAFLRARV